MYFIFANENTIFLSRPRLHVKVAYGTMAHIRSTICMTGSNQQEKIKSRSAALSS